MAYDHAICARSPRTASAACPHALIAGYALPCLLALLSCSRLLPGYSGTWAALTARRR